MKGDDAAVIVAIIGALAIVLAIFVFGHKVGQSEGARDQCEKEYVDAARCIKDPEDGDFWIPVYTTTVEVSE